MKNEDFEIGNKIKQNYKDLFDIPKHITLDGSIENIQENLSKLKDYLNVSNSHHILPSTQQNNSQINTDLPILPPIIVESKDFEGEPFVDRYYDEIRQLFVFNNSECCKEFPDPDESVFVSSVLILVYICFHVVFYKFNFLTNPIIISYSYYSTFVALSKKCQKPMQRKDIKN